MDQDIRICFVGDSFVNGTGDETALGWAGRLCADAISRGTPVTYYNLGVRRNTSKDVLFRWEQECTSRLSMEFDCRVVFSCGVNDSVFENGAARVSPEESRSNVRKLLIGAKKYKLLMVGPPPVGDEVQNERIKALSQVFAQETRILRVPYIDLFSPLSLDSAYKQEVAANDGAHPKSNGYSKLAQIVGSSPKWWFHKP